MGDAWGTLPLDAGKRSAACPHADVTIIIATVRITRRAMVLGTSKIIGRSPTEPSCKVQRSIVGTATAGSITSDHANSAFSLDG
jgi:hypothetical protein